MKKQENKVHIIQNNLYLVKMLLKIAPGRVAATAALALMNYFSWLFYTVLFMQYLFNSFEVKRTFTEILGFIVLSMVLFCAVELYSSWYYNKYMPLTDQIINYKMNMILFDKATAVDLSCYENPDFYNNYTRAISETNGRTTAILDNITSVTASLIALVYLMFTLVHLDIFMSVAVFIPLVGSLLFSKVSARLQYERNTADIPYTRRVAYVNRVVFLQKFAKEIRLSKIFNVMKDINEAGYKGLTENVKRTRKKMFFIDFLRAVSCFSFVFEGAWLYVAFRAIVTKTLNIGDFVVLGNAIVMATNILTQLGDNIAATIQNGTFVQNLRTFLSYQEKIPENADGLKPGRISTLEFKNVSFTYEGQNEPTLRNISFTIKNNEKIALVGHNGAGKTTLVKLIMRLYDVTEGEILLNGVNIKEYSVRDYRKLFGTIFQDYQIMSMSVAENVLMSEVKTDIQRSLCVDALNKSNVYDKVKTLNSGMDTVLTREFDDNGAVLSGGENQKIAVARAFAKDSKMIILDEPSSALDPIAEYSMYETLAKTYSERGKEKAVIMISHRLSSAVVADKIFMFENGEIIEEGSHRDLMRKKGKYCDMFNKQASNYQQSGVRI